MKSIFIDDLPSIALTSPGETDPLGMGQEIDFGELEASLARSTIGPSRK